MSTSTWQVTGASSGLGYAEPGRPQRASLGVLLGHGGLPRGGWAAEASLQVATGGRCGREWSAMAADLAPGRRCAGRGRPPGPQARRAGRGRWRAPRWGRPGRSPHAWRRGGRRALPRRGADRGALLRLGRRTAHRWTPRRRISAGRPGPWSGRRTSSWRGGGGLGGHGAATVGAPGLDMRISGYHVALAIAVCAGCYGAGRMMRPRTPGQSASCWSPGTSRNIGFAEPGCDWPDGPPERAPIEMPAPGDGNEAV
jgi:hypothetical protein